MILELRGQQVSQVAFGYEIVLLTDAGASLRIGAGYRYGHSPDESVFVEDPENSMAVACQLVSLFQQAIERAVVSDSGELRVEFKSGAWLEVPVSDRFEAWDLDMPGTPSKIVSTPGGELAIWD